MVEKIKLRLVRSVYWLFKQRSLFGSLYKWTFNWKWILIFDVWRMEGDPSHNWKSRRAQWRRIVSSPEIFDPSLVRWPASNRIDSLASAVNILHHCWVDSRHTVVCEFFRSETCWKIDSCLVNRSSILQLNQNSSCFCYLPRVLYLMNSLHESIQHWVAHVMNTYPCIKWEAVYGHPYGCLYIKH